MNMGTRTIGFRDNRSGEVDRAVLMKLREQGGLTRTEASNATIVYQNTMLRRGEGSQRLVPVAVVAPDRVLLLMGNNTYKVMTHDQITLPKLAES